MKVKREQNIIEYGSKTVKLDELLAELASKDSKEVAKYLVENTSLPRELRTNALRLVLNDYVKMAKELDLSDEFMYRLNWYEKFSEYQLVNFWNILVTKNSNVFNEAKEVKRFKETFYLLMMVNANAIDFQDHELKALTKLPEDANESFQEFLNESDGAFYDFEYNFDGLSYEDFKSVLKKSSTVADIRNIASKYGINVPKRLKKDEFVALVAEGLRRQGKYDETTEEKLKKMSAISLQRFAKVNNINASTEMKKDDIIDYIMNRIESAPKSVRKPRIELVSLPEIEEFSFDRSYLREVAVVDEDDDNVVAPKVLDSTEIGSTQPVEEPVVEEVAPVVEEPVEEPVVEAKPSQNDAILEKLIQLLIAREQREVAKEEELAAKEAARLEEEAKRAEEEARLAEERATEEARKAEEERIAAEKAAEEARLAEELRLAEEEAKRAEEEAKRAEEERIAAELARIEEARLAEEERLAAEKAAEEERIAAEKAAEEARRAEEQAAREAALIQALEEVKRASEEREAALIKALEEAKKPEPVTVKEEPKQDQYFDSIMKLYDNHIHFLEQTIFNFQNKEEKPVVQEQPSPLPIDIHVTVPKDEQEVIKIIEPVVLNNLDDEPKPLQEVVEEPVEEPAPVVEEPAPVVEEGSLEPVIVDSNFDELSKEERAENAKRLFKEAEKVVYDDEPEVSKGKARKARRKLKKLSKRQAKLDKMRYKNEKRVYKQYKRRKFWKVFWTIFWLIILLAVLLVTFWMLIDFAVLPEHQIITTIDGVISKIPGCAKDGVVRGTIYGWVEYVVNFVKNLIGA